MGSVLVVGASGLIGAEVVSEYLRQGWEVVAMSRRRPDLTFEGDGFTHLPIDLLDEPAVKDAVEQHLQDVSHVVYCAVYEKPGLVAGWRDPEQMAVNKRMISNILGPLATKGALQHVSIFQGTKAYGVHLHPIPVPARERFERDPHENFYWLQEDYLRDLADKHGFAWTIFRPTVVLGPTVGVAMNVLPVVGVFAAVSKKLGVGFGYPGHIPYVREAVDVRLIAEAAAWASTSENARNHHFNLTNGEVFSWKEEWTRMAEVLGVEVAEDSPLSLGDFLADKDAVWEEIRREHGLRDLSLPQILGESHHYADFCFGYGLTEAPPPAFVSTVKVKEAGFSRVFDTSHCIEHWLRAMGDRSIIPVPQVG